MRYVIFEDPSRPLAHTETLSGAFAEVLTRAERRAVWGRSVSGEVTLQLAYLGGDRSGEMVGGESGEPEIYSAPASGGQDYARRLIMGALAKAGVCGYYACKETDLQTFEDALAY